MANSSKRNGDSQIFKADIDDLVIFDDARLAGETYIFEPAGQESQLGYLVAVAETENKEGLGKELMDTVIQALQREYYRDPRRGVIASFESALHQANLVLNDLAEQGVREWVGCWHVGVGVLAGRSLHISTAGEGSVILQRGGKTTMISAGLSHSPITNPLRTFSQVASGSVEKRDIVFFGTAKLFDVFKSDDLSRFTSDQSASVIAMRLKQLYEDQRRSEAVAVLVMTIMPSDMAGYAPGEHESGGGKRDAIGPSALQPRQPLNINQSLLKALFRLLGRAIAFVLRSVRRTIWPSLVATSRQGGRMIYEASRKAGRGVQGMAKRKALQNTRRNEAMDSSAIKSQRRISFKPAVAVKEIQSLPRRMVFKAIKVSRNLPMSSRIFAVLAVILMIGLAVSIVMLQNKRAADAQFRKASEWLHEARVKHEAAETALIYDNREQARTLLRESRDLADKTFATGLYEEQIGELRNEIIAVEDRLAKISRPDTSEVETLGDFKTAVAQKPPTRIFYLQGKVYTFNPATNVIVSMSETGETKIESNQTQGIGFFEDGSSQEADKILILATDEPGVALFDAKTGVVQKQDIVVPGNEAKIKALATFGNRLYALEETSNLIYGYSKTLRGYSNGSAWLTEGADAGTITDLAVDGFIYTFSPDGDLQKWYKGERVDDFKMETVDPPLSHEARIIHDEELRYIYMFDKPHNRVVMFDTNGVLVKQLYFGDDTLAVDVAVEPEEKFLYALDGTIVKKVRLVEE